MLLFSQDCLYFLLCEIFCIDSIYYFHLSVCIWQSYKQNAFTLGELYLD